MTWVRCTMGVSRAGSNADPSGKLCEQIGAGQAQPRGVLPEGGEPLRGGEGR